ncbi:hypothetical protein CCACVL1_17230 [Corchorus capsularis]|uniref:Uncharacterized protein n=1 Tax=Corchorus capsularis TaxID=210143 RepID=A0A1R3HT45_COCAP|nr:hypothetical protein CCACVL1_17230 [Corchorus capsularis]
MAGEIMKLKIRALHRERERE